ncbi:MAG: UDP-glucose 4-epimerase GalE [Saprospiraceae bacterium]
MALGKKVLVTGGAGYIGSHTVIALVEAGFSPLIADNFVNSERKTLDRLEDILGFSVPCVEVDLANDQATAALFEAHADIVAVIHFAALKAVGESVENPIAYYRNNLFSLLNVLANVQKNGIASFIFSSSCTVYGEPDQLPLTEDSPIKEAASPYGNTKQMGEEIIRDAVLAGSIQQAISLRYFNPVGAHASGKLGELPIGVPNNLLPFITQTGAGLRSELQVFGKNYNTADGTAVRDYIHVEDLAEAHVVSVKRLLEKRNSENYEVFNLGTGEGHTVLEVIQSFERTSGQKLPYRITDRRPGDVSATYADTSKAKNILGWTASRNLDDMTRSAWIWEKHLRGIE